MPKNGLAKNGGFSVGSPLNQDEEGRLKSRHTSCHDLAGVTHFSAPCELLPRCQPQLVTPRRKASISVFLARDDLFWLHVPSRVPSECAQKLHPFCCYHYQRHPERYTVDGQNPAPPKKPWNDDSPVNTIKAWFAMVSHWCSISIHSRKGNRKGSNSQTNDPGQTCDHPQVSRYGQIYCSRSSKEGRQSYLRRTATQFQAHPGCKSPQPVIARISNHLPSLATKAGRKVVVETFLRSQDGSRASTARDKTGLPINGSQPHLFGIGMCCCCVVLCVLKKKKKKKKKKKNFWG